MAIQFTRIPPDFFILLSILVWQVQCLTTVKQNTRKNVIRTEEEFHQNPSGYYEHVEKNNFKPWTFPEKIPHSKNKEVNRSELAWTASAGQLIRLLNPKIYNKLQAPGQIHGKNTHVEVAMYVESMSTFRAQTMDFDVDIYFMMYWLDERLKHNSTYPILLNDENLADLMWYPDLYFVNAKFSYMHRVTTPNFMVVVYSDGYVMRTMRVEVTLACNLDLRNFPMDIQTCPIVFQSYAYVSNVVKLSWHSSDLRPIHFNPTITVNDMYRIKVGYDRCDSDYPLFRGPGRWSCLTGTITMKRKLRFHVFQMFVPGAMLVVISWFSFWFDIRASPARVSLTVTTLLTLTTMSNSYRLEMPKVPYLKANDIWFSVCLGFIFSVLLEYAIVNWFLSKQTSTARESTSVCRNYCRHPKRHSENSEASSHSPVEVTSWETFAKRTDSIAKVLFPLCFLVFIITYCSIFYFKTFT